MPSPILEEVGKPPDGADEGLEEDGIGVASSVGTAEDKDVMTKDSVWEREIGDSDRMGGVSFEEMLKAWLLASPKDCPSSNIERKKTFEKVRFLFVPTSQPKLVVLITFSRTMCEPRGSNLLMIFDRLTQDVFWIFHPILKCSIDLIEDYRHGPIFFSRSPCNS